MTAVVVTRLRARGLRGARDIVRLTGQVVADARSVDGFLGGRLVIEPRGVFWTLTAWESPESLRAFAALHAPVAAGIDDVAVESATGAFRVPERVVPSWADAAGRTTLGNPGRGLHRAIPAAPAGQPVPVGR